MAPLLRGELPLTAARMVRQWALARKPELQDIGSVPLCTCLWKKLLAPMTTNDWPMVDVLRVKALDAHRLGCAFPTAAKVCAIFQISSPLAAR